MGDEVNPTAGNPGLVVGNEWWQQIASYGISRAVDAEFLLPYTTRDQSQQIGKGSNGDWYQQGVPSGFAAIASNPVMLLGGLLLIGGVLFLALKD